MGVYFDKYKELRQNLLTEINILCAENYGLQRLICDDLGKTKQQISRVLSGQSASFELLDEILESAKNQIKYLPEKKIKKVKKKKKE